MANEVNINQTLNEVEALNTQIATLNAMLAEKKKDLANYFDSTGECSIANDRITAYVQERTKVEYDIPKLKYRITKRLYNQIVNREYVVSDWNGLKEFFKDRDIKPLEVQRFLTVNRTINEAKLQEFYEQGEISLEDLKGAYTAKVTKSIAIRAKKE